MKNDVKRKMTLRRHPNHVRKSPRVTCAQKLFAHLSTKRFPGTGQNAHGCSSDVCACGVAAGMADARRDLVHSGIPIASPAQHIYNYSVKNHKGADLWRVWTKL
jgi:hypothetical protein